MSESAEMAMTRRRLMVAGAAAGVGACAPLARAQTRFPQRPISLYVPVAPGGVVDTILRVAASGVSSILKQPVVVENRPGGNTAIGTQLLARARSDGHTMGIVGTVQLLLPFTEKVSFDPLRDFTYVVGMFGFSSGAVVRADSKFKTFADLVEAARAAPGKIAIGNTGPTTPGGLAIRYFAREHGIQFLDVPFRGADANVALLGGHIDSTWGGPTWIPQVDAGQFRLLSTFSERRPRRYPDVPTAKELGYPVTQVSTAGICGPAGMDIQVTRTLHDAFKQVLNAPDFQKVSTEFMCEDWYKSSAEFEAWARAEHARNQVLARELGLSSGR